MVAPYEIGDPVRSFVRVTGSGTNKDATPVCWDLSRSSTVAAAEPVQQALPSASQITLSKPEECTSKNVRANSEEQRSNVPLKSEETSLNVLSVDPPTEERNEQESSERKGQKRRCIAETGTFENADSSDVTPPSAKIARVRSIANESTSSAASSSVISEQEDGVAAPVSNELAKLMKECDRLRQENHKMKSEINEEHEQLRQENMELKERLSLFHDLFKNKNRLAILLRRLNMHQLTSCH